MIYRAKTGNIVSKFLHSKKITLSTTQVLNLVCFLIFDTLLSLLYTII